MEIRELRQKRAKAVSDARALLDAAANENRDLTADENTRYEAFMAEVDRLAATITREERVRDLEREMGTQQREAHRPDPQDPGPGTEQRGTAPANLPPTATPEYRSGFWGTMRAGGRARLSGEEVRALQEGTDTEGGYLVPTEMDKQILQGLAVEDIMRGYATVITSSTDRQIPVATGHGQAYWVAEEGAFTESDEQFGQILIGAHKLGTLIKVSEELLNDSAFDLEAYLVKEFARRFSRREEAGFFSGDGVSKPRGLIDRADLGVTAASATAVAADELIDLYHAVPRPYRAKATWMMADNTVKAVRKLKTGGASGDYLWQPGLQAGQPDRNLGRPLAISDDVPAMASGNRSIALGDLSYYWIVDRQGTVFQRLNELFATTGQVGFRAFRRVDGNLILTEAVKVLKQA